MYQLKVDIDKLNAVLRRRANARNVRYTFLCTTYSICENKALGLYQLKVVNVVYRDLAFIYFIY